MIRRITILIAALAALAIIPAAASACQAEAGGTAYVASPTPNHYDGAAGISCATATGDLYQVRGYFQTNNGGWHIATGYASVYYTSGTAGKSFHFAVNCYDLYGGGIFTAIRVKTVIENYRTGGIDVAYGPQRTAVAPVCNGDPTP